MADQTPVLQVKHLFKSFGSAHILKGVDLTIERGQTLVVLGRSGTGKSVLLKHIVGMLKPDRGSVKVFGQEVADLEAGELNELRKRIGFLFQSAALFDSFSVRGNLAFFLERHTDLKPSEIDERVIEALTLVGLAEKADKNPSDLSGGQRKRIGLARSIILNPELMLYDEPTTGLDPITSDEISKLILGLQQSFGMTSIVITHDMPCAHLVADRAVMLRDGEFIFDGSMDDLRESEIPFIQEFYQSALFATDMERSNL